MKNKILIIKLGALGDVLRTTCILPALKERYKNSYIVWLTKKESIPLLQNNPLIDRIDDGIKKIFREKFDLVINLDEELETCKLANRVGKKITGTYAENSKINYTEDSKEWFDMGLISKFGKKRADQLKKENKKSYPEIIINMLGMKFNKKRHKPQLVLTKEEKDFGLDFLKKNDIVKNKLIIGLNTDSGHRWTTKKMGIKKTAQLAEDIAKAFDAQIILLSEGKKERTKKIIKKSKIKIIDSGNNDLRRFSSIINVCDLIITSDSLVLHPAISLGKKFICFFGPTSASEIEAYNLGEKIIPQVDCLCCYRHKCKFKKSCINKLDNKLFINAIKKLLNI